IVVTGGGGYAARNVARDLARCGFQLAGRPPPTGALPTRWREEYERLVGGRAPARWDPVTDRRAPAERAGSVDRIVRKLGKSLGVRFPKLTVPKPAPPPMKRIP
ncbi:MAG TPA: hypothetical protein VGS23_09670, partial [Thermoplasmata archaeon]|nr:hypothetical protein [Thermoplasmata archaeon]